MSILIDIAKEYTKMPGGRYIKEGKFSGEDFRKKLLKPAFLKSKQEKTELVVNLDGGYGYAPSFLEEAFGGLTRELKDPEILNIIIISEEEPALVDKIQGYIKDVLK